MAMLVRNFRKIIPQSLTSPVTAIKVVTIPLGRLREWMSEIAGPVLVNVTESLPFDLKAPTFLRLARRA